MPEPRDIIQRLSAVRSERARAEREAHAQALRQRTLLREKQRAERKGDRQAVSTLERSLEESRAAALRADEARGTARRAAFELVTGLHEAHTVEQLTALWSAELPILLLPLRVETRFKGSELLVRVFPDQISIDTHEELLTQAEAKAGREYWQAIAADGSETRRREAWRKLEGAFRAPRAGYVVERTKPSNWSELATVGASGLTFPNEPVLKEDGWTQPPLVKVLPDRLLLLLGNDGKLRQQLGALIPDIVHAGPTPLLIDGNPSWQRGADGRLVFDEDTEWLRDFDRAVKNGLGFRVALQPGEEQGFSELFVLGLKHSVDPVETEARLSELLRGHRYSEKGAALVPQGKATNNTSAEDSGLDTLDWFAEASFAAREGAGGPENPADWNSASDGFRLAAYLGLDPAVFERLPHADGRDHAEAVAMNVALYPGTLGYFLRTMIGEVASDDTLAELRQFFTRSVSGRGPLAALRVGPQPYGIVLAGLPPRARDGGRPEGSIDAAVADVLARARKYWRGLLPEVARLGASENASADLLAVLGLQPSAVEYFQRIASTFDHLSNLAGFLTSGDRMEDVFESAFAGYRAEETLRGLGYERQRENGSQKPYPLLFQLIYQQHQTLIPQTSLIDERPLSEAELIEPYDSAKTKNYIDWLAANARNADALRRQDFSGAPRPKALLYLLLRHALLIQLGTSVNRWLKLFEIDAPELVTSRKFVGMLPSVDVAAWEILSAPASAVTSSVKSSLPLLSLVQLPEYRRGAHAPIGAPIEEMLAAYTTLRSLPTARLERLFAEHVDTLSYRLDAWETALLDRRLARRRSGKTPATPRRGLYLGAVGYLENVRPARRARVEISERELPESLREGRGNLYRHTNTAGFVHAPSLNHATAGAILRNGYLTHATPDDPGRLAINLSSRRVRRAKELSDGVRNGQPLEVLLGIELERGLHDATTRPTHPIVLNHLKPLLRAAFPIKRTRLPKAGHPADAPEIVPDFSVVNGLDVVAANHFPSGVAGLPPLSTAEIDELKAIRERMRDSLDSLKDVITTEAAYQLALGNFDRSAGIVQSLAAALSPPEIEVTRSSRGTDLAFTQRLTIELNPTTVANPWPTIALTPRAKVELPLNAWLGALLGDPAGYACQVTLTEPGGASLTTSVRLAQLALQPLDLLAITRGVRDASGPQALEARVYTVALAATGASRAANVEIRFNQTGLLAPAVAPMAEALSVLDLAHQVLGSSRPLDGRDGLTQSKPLPPGTEPSGINVGELRLRFDALLDTADTLVTDLQTAVASAQATGAGAAESVALRAVLRRAADLGIPFAFPSGPDDGLVPQGEAAVRTLGALRDRATTLATQSQAAGLTPPQSTSKLIEATQQLLGADFRVLPRFTAPNAADLAACDAARDALLATARASNPAIDPVSEVLTSVAQVRLAVHRLLRLRLMGELMTGSQPALVALQLPPRAGDSWLGGALPPGHVIADDTLSLLQLRPQGFAPAAARCGLVVDEWTESFPRKTEVTGVAFGFDQPNSMPLQSLLLAVASEGAQTWSWSELVAIVRDTVLRAKLRAVEPDLLDRVPGVTTLVPATLAEFSTSPGALSLDFGLSVPAVLSQIVGSAYQVELAAAGPQP